MSVCSLFGALLSWAAICAPAHNIHFSASAHGYSETTEGRELVAEAITRANEILGGAGFALEPGWNDYTRTDDTVPVYLIRGDPADMIFVPARCRCIVIVSRTLVAWLRTTSTDPNGDLDVDRTAALSFMLLHEIGHIAGGDQDAAFSSLPSDTKKTNLTPTSGKTREFAADAWAADVVRAASQPGSPGFLSAMGVQMAAGAMSWNLARRRLIDNFGATVLRDPRVIFDEGYSHPNFELRMLVVNELLTGSDAAKALRAEFERLRDSERQEGVRPAILNP